MTTTRVAVPRKGRPLEAVLERLATPRELAALATRFAEAGPETPPPGWLRDEIDGLNTFADACRTLAAVLAALGAGRIRRLGR